MRISCFKVSQAWIEPRTFKSDSSSLHKYAKGPQAATQDCTTLSHLKAEIHSQTVITRHCIIVRNMHCTIVSNMHCTTVSNMYCTIYGFDNCILRSGPRHKAHVYIWNLYMEQTNPWICWQMLLSDLYIWLVKVAFVHWSCEVFKVILPRIEPPSHENLSRWSKFKSVSSKD
jgi:hypothetical protein